MINGDNDCGHDNDDHSDGGGGGDGDCGDDSGKGDHAILFLLPVHIVSSDHLYSLVFSVDNYTHTAALV